MSSERPFALRQQDMNDLLALFSKPVASLEDMVHELELMGECLKLGALGTKRGL